MKRRALHVSTRRLRIALAACVIALVAMIGTSSAPGSAFQFPDTTVYLGEPQPVPFQLITDFPVQGISASVAYDPEVIAVTAVSFEGTMTEAIPAEYYEAEILANGAGITIGVLVDALPPFEGQLFPGTGLPLAVAQVMVEVLDRPGPMTTQLRFVDDLKPAIRNIMSVSNESRLPDSLIDGTLTIPRVPHFVRGDANQHGGVDISDAISIVRLLFLGGITIPCSDAADANDDESLDLADAIFVLQYYFLGGSHPPAPFPDPGPDPVPLPGTIDLDCQSPSLPGGWPLRQSP